MNIKLKKNTLLLAILAAGFATGNAAASDTCMMSDGTSGGATAAETDGVNNNDDNFACGSGAVANESNNPGAGGAPGTEQGNGGAMAIGYHASATNSRATAIGPSATASGMHSMAIGAHSTASNASATAIGTTAIASGANATAIGFAASATNTHSLALGALASATGNSGVAIGSQANAGGTFSVSIGNGAVANSTTAVAIGQGAQASHAGSIAIGSGSRTAAATSVPTGTIFGTQYGYAGSGSSWVVSFADVTNGGSRQLLGVSAGRVTASSTDAINGSQLFATHQAINQVGALASAGWNITAEGANGTNVAPGEAVDFNNADDNIVVSKSPAGDSLTFDLNDDIMVDSLMVGDTTLTSNGLFMLGGPSITAAGFNAGGKVITNVAAGTADTDAVNVAQLNATATQVYNNAVSTSNTYTDSRITNLEQGLTGDYVEQGAQAGANSVAVGTGSQTTADNAVALGSGSVADRANSVSVGSAGAERQVTNVAAGTADTDAVNVKQMRDADAAVLNEANSYTDQQISNITGVLAGDYVEQGDQSGTNSVAVGTGSQTTGNNAVALGSGSVADQDNTVSVGAAGAERRVTNVAAGVAGTDAANVDQVRAGDAATLTQANTYTDSRTSYAISESNAYTDTQIDQLSNQWNDRWEDLHGQVNDLGRRMDRMGAMNAALTMMVGSSAESPAPVSLQFGVGFYGASAAAAVGLKARLNDRSALSLGLSHDGRKALGGAGLSINLW